MKTKYSNMWNLFSSIIFVPLNLLIISLSNNVKSFPMNDSQNIKSNTTVQTTISYRRECYKKYNIDIFMFIANLQLFKNIQLTI